MVNELICKSVRLRLVQPSDAEFIFDLRTDQKYNKHLSQVSGTPDDQRAWIERYKAREEKGEEFYFIIERLDGVRCGTVRVYDLQDDSFCWGSWILNKDKTRFSALESAILVYDFGFDQPGKAFSHFDVRSDNVSVIRFHERFSVSETHRDDINIYFKLNRDLYQKDRQKFIKFINSAAKV